MIVVTAPTGHIGSQLVDDLLDSGEPVRVIVRDPSRLSAKARSHVEVVKGSHGDGTVVDKAFEGADSVFWLPPPDPKAASMAAVYVDFTRPACAAFTRQGVKRVVAISALGHGTPMAGRAGHVTASLAMDDLIASTGVNLRVLTMPSFMDNLMGQVEPIRSQGMFFGPLSADRKFPTCATSDIAAVAARLLLDHSWSGQESVAVLGPEDLSCDDMAQIVSEVLGKPVRYQQVSMEAFTARLAESGVSEAMVAGYADMMMAKNDGLDNAVPRTAESTTPTSFRQWCERVLKPAVLG